MRWRSDGDAMSIKAPALCSRSVGSSWLGRARLSGSAFSFSASRSSRARGDRVAPAPSSRWPRPAPLAGLLLAFTWPTIARALCSAFSGLLGAPARLRGSCVGPGLARCPLAGARFIVVRPFFHLFCGGAFPAPIAHWRKTSALWPPLLFPPAAGCPCRAPAPVSPARRGARPFGGSRFARHSGVPPGVFFGWRLEQRAGVSGGLPSVRWPEVCPPAPLPECPPLVVIFCPARGPGACPLPCSGLAPLRPSRGAFRRPPAPRAAATRRAVFFIVFCFLRFRNFGALSYLHRIKKHK